MNLQEVNQRLTGFKITEKQLEDITPAYYTMNLDKDIFIKILEVVGVEEITRLKGYFEDSNSWEEYQSSSIVPLQLPRDEYGQMLAPTMKNIKESAEKMLKNIA